MRAFAIVLACGAFLACGAGLTSTDKSELAEYKASMSACLVAHPSNKPAQDDCIKQVQADWRAKWNERFDGGF